MHFLGHEIRKEISTIIGIASKIVSLDHSCFNACSNGATRKSRRTLENDFSALALLKRSGSVKKMVRLILTHLANIATFGLRSPNNQHRESAERLHETFRHASVTNEPFVQSERPAKQGLRISHSARFQPNLPARAVHSAALRTRLRLSADRLVARCVRQRVPIAANHAADQHA